MMMTTTTTELMTSVKTMMMIELLPQSKRACAFDLPRIAQGRCQKVLKIFGPFFPPQNMLLLGSHSLSLSLSLTHSLSLST